MPVLRPCGGALASALASGATDRGSMADLFTVTLQSGTVYRWTMYDIALTVGANTFFPGNNAAGQPWLSRSRSNVVNTMEIPTLEIFIDTTALAGFAGGPTLLAQIQNGLFDGATCFLQRVFMPTPGDTATWGTIDLFLGDIGAATLVAPRATLKVRGKNSRLDVMMPRNLYQASCAHTFCDAGCTLNAATFTFSETATAGSTRAVVAWSVSGIFLGLHPFKGGTLKMTSGANNGLSRGIIDVSTSTITLDYPLPFAPATSDTFTVFQGCDKTMATCTTPYANLANYRGTPFVPSPDTTGPV